MGLIERMNSPEDLKQLRPDQLAPLAQEIREFLVESVARTGGHLGPNLGVVELTIAIHRIFDSPRDPIVFDTGHQSYVHKLLTGRHDFSTLRHKEGLSGYPSRAESVHDVVENSHASASLSWADGIARAFQVREIDDRYVVAVIGDGALTGGMAWEALNNIAADINRRVVVVVNDNGRSYAPTIGGLANHLDVLRTTQDYEKLLDWGKRTLRRGGMIGEFVYDALHGFKKGVKDVVAPQGLFEDLGIKYVGPVDGHDIAALELALTRARAFNGPVIVHAITEKGRGYVPAESDTVDRFHAVGVIHPETGLPVAPSRFGWTAVFADEMIRVGRRRSDVVALTAAMLAPVGLAPFAKEFPKRVFDVGIAEQHAATTAAGLAFGGLHPVIALYATFLNRAFDQILMDVALHRAGVTFVLDRAGLTGDDGASHNGMWDMALLRIVPGLRLAAPRDEATLREALREAVEIDDGPTVIRYPKGAVPAKIEAHGRVGTTDILSFNSGTPQVRSAPDGEAAADVLIVSVGAMAGTALEVGARLRDQGIGSTVIDPRWVLPIPSEIPEFARNHRLVLTLEDGLVEGGVGHAIGQRLREAALDTPVHSVGIPIQFLEHARRDQLVLEFGMDAQNIAREIASAFAELETEVPLDHGQLGAESPSWHDQPGREI